MQALSDLISRREDWLVQRIIRYAKEYGYTAYAPTLTGAWRSSVCGLSQSLIKALAEYSEPPQIFAGGNFADDSISAFGIEVARRHRSRGISLRLFLGLMKHYRQAYLDLLELGELAGERLAYYREFINRFYARVELGFCSEWASQSESAMVLAAAEQNRLLANEKNKYLTIFESLKDPVVLLDSAGRIENANHAAAELFGGSAVSGAGYYGSDHLTLLEGELPGLVGRDGEHLLTTTLGERSFDVKSQAMLDVSEKFAGTVLIFNDVSDYKLALEQAEQANRTKSAFLAAVSHEIRTPVNGIVGATTLLRDTPLAGQQQDYVNVLSISSEILAALISDILDYSKIEAGVLEIESIDFTMEALVNDVLALMLPAAAAKGLALTTDIASGLPATFNGDFGKLRQILFNLVGNAVKFTERGMVRLRVERSQLHDPERYLRFSVIDSGIGIPPSCQARIFSAFVQADAAVARKYGGTGLGLAICQRLVSALGGTIGVESNTDCGSVFWFELPLQRAEKVHGCNAVSLDSVLDPLTVLVVDDNEINRLVATGLLERSGHRAVAVTSGSEALQALQATPFDLVLMDLNLPGLSGLETIRLIRANGAFGRVPIAVVSALVTRDDIQSSQSAGADAFLGKPYRPAQLEATIRAVMRQGGGTQADAARLSTVDPLDTVRGLASAADPEVDEGILSGHARELGTAVTDQLISLFVGAARTSLSEAQQAFHQSAMRDVIRAAHRLNSSAATIGLQRLGRLLGEIEMAARNSANDRIAELLEQLQQGLPVTIAALQSTWATIRSGKG